MKEMLEAIKGILAIIGGWIGYMCGGIDGFFYMLFTFVIIDYITGVMVAVVDRELSSEVGFVGICKKISIFMLVAIAHFMDLYILTDQGESILRTAVIFFYLSNERISILENCAWLGLPIPEKLRRILAQIDDEENEKK